MFAHHAYMPTLLHLTLKINQDALYPLRSTWVLDLRLYAKANFQAITEENIHSLEMFVQDTMSTSHVFHFVTSQPTPSTTHLPEANMKAQSFEAGNER
jgi:hypothetical protein